MNIVILDGYTANPGDLSWDGFAALGNLTVHDRTPDSEIIPRIGGAEIAIVNKTPITRAVLDACPNLRYVGVLATGYNIVDTQAAKEKGVMVSNIPSYSTAAVAQLTIALLLEMCHHVGGHSDAVHRGKWADSPDFCFWNHPLIELAGKTMGIIGFGRIGVATAQIAKALGMEILAYSRRQTPLGVSLAKYVTLDELLEGSDVISLHCPLNEDTQGIIHQASIAKMKDGVMLLNTSRGPLVVEQDLADALNSGKVAGAGVDVVSVEPIRQDNPLLTAKNCFITPHIAWAPKESRIRLLETAAANLKAFLDGKPVNIVNL